MSTEPTTIIKGGERMFAHRRTFCKAVVALLSTLALAGASGCGGSGDEAGSTAPASTSSAAGASGAQSGSADTADADPADLKVIEDWSAALAEGDVEAAAGYFAIPSTAENPPLLAKIDSAKDAIAFNKSLPCGAEVLSASTQGDLTTATFRLTDRPGGDCGAGVGGKASTSFDIEDGKIVEWRRIDDAPGSAGGAPESDPV
jgi:limonene-1,2-epoxide hydrolase